jgi:hypothetical protein
MRLEELTGYKSHPLGQAAARLKPSNGKQVWDLAYDVVNMRDFVKVAAEHNWTRIGGGKYSNVFRHPGYHYMVKVFVRDPEYLRYFNLVKSMQGNPHVPRVRGKFMKVGTEGYVVRLEPLTSLDSAQDPIFKKYVHPSLPPTMDSLLDERNIDYLEKKFPALMELFYEIFGLSTTLDWHDGNLMKRGNTLVITDPIAT